MVDIDIKEEAFRLLEQWFKLSNNKTNVRTEVFAGITTFMTMAYIIFVNPGMLAAAGMNPDAVFAATCIAAAIATITMGLVANYPFALAPGMGLNAYFAFTVGIRYGYRAALAAVFVSGMVFILLTVTKAREAIINSIPMSLKLAVGAGIGLFIAFIGFQNAGLVVTDANTLVHLGNLRDPQVLLAVFGLVVTSILVVQKVRGSLLLGIVVTTIVGIITGVTPVAEGFSLAPAMPNLQHIGEFVGGFGDLFALGLAAIPIVFSFAFVDVFDTIGTLVGVASKAQMLDKDGKLPRANNALVADAVGTVAGAVLGTSTVTTYVESAAGVTEGGRTGLTAIVTGILFLVALFFAPLAGLVPGVATAPILIIVGVFMMEPITKINFGDYMEAIPAFFAIAMMPFTFSIAEGIVWGVLSYVILKLAARKFNDVSLTMYILAFLFVLRFFL